MSCWLVVDSGDKWRAFAGWRSWFCPLGNGDQRGRHVRLRSQNCEQRLLFQGRCGSRGCQSSAAIQKSVFTPISVLKAPCLHKKRSSTGCDRTASSIGIVEEKSWTRG